MSRNTKTPPVQFVVFISRSGARHTKKKKAQPKIEPTLPSLRDVAAELLEIIDAHESQLTSFSEERSTFDTLSLIENEGSKDRSTNWSAVAERNFQLIARWHLSLPSTQEILQAATTQHARSSIVIPNACSSEHATRKVLFKIEIWSPFKATEWFLESGRRLFGKFCHL